MEETVRVLSEVSAEVKMPKKLYVGDPMYFEEFEGAKLKKLTYAKEFIRGKGSWVGSVKITEQEGTFEFNGEDVPYEEVVLNICFAPNQKLLDIYKEGSVLRSQKQKDTEIGVDTARYVIGVNDRETTIDTMGDGYWGNVLELYNGSKLEGIVINLSTGEANDMKRNKSELEYLFDMKFE